MGEWSPAGKLSKGTTDVGLGESSAIDGRARTDSVTGGGDEAAYGVVQSAVGSAG